MKGIVGQEIIIILIFIPFTAGIIRRYHEN